MTTSKRTRRRPTADDDELDATLRELIAVLLGIRDRAAHRRASTGDIGGKTP